MTRSLLQSDNIATPSLPGGPAGGGDKLSPSPPVPPGREGSLCCRGAYEGKQRADLVDCPIKYQKQCENAQRKKRQLNDPKAARTGPDFGASLDRLLVPNLSPTKDEVKPQLHTSNTTHALSLVNKHQSLFTLRFLSIASPIPAG